MAPFRTVNTAFWQSPQVVDNFSAMDRYTYLYLLTNPYTNLCGCYEISVRQIADETGLHRDEIRNALYRLQVIHKVLDYHPETKEILLFNWLDQNWTASPTWQKRIKKEIAQRKCWVFKLFLRAQCHRLLNEYSQAKKRGVRPRTRTPPFIP